MMPIVTAPNSVLSTRAKEVVKVDKSVVALVEEMKKTLASTHDPEGVGLAAPQVGKSVRIFIMKPSKDAAVSVFINPVVTLHETKETHSTSSGQAKTKKKKESKLEGCLSLPTIWGVVRRQPKAEVTYLDEHSTKHTKTFEGFEATIIQHELDHLDGILFPKRVLEQKEVLYKSTKNKKGEDVFEELDI